MQQILQHAACRWGGCFGITSAWAWMPRQRILSITCVNKSPGRPVADWWIRPGMAGFLAPLAGSVVLHPSAQKHPWRCESWPSLPRRRPPHAALPVGRLGWQPHLSRKNSVIEAHYFRSRAGRSTIPGHKKEDVCGVLHGVDLAQSFSLMWESVLVVSPIL